MLRKAFTLLLLVLTLLSVISLTGCKGDSYTGWTVTEMKDTQTMNSKEYYAVFRISSADSGIIKTSNVWINLSNTFDSEVKINLAFSHGSSITSPHEEFIRVSSNDISSNGGWVKLIEGATTIDYYYVEICVTQSMKLNEIVLISTEGEKLILDLVLCGERPKRGSNSKNEFTAEEIRKKIEAGEMDESPLNLVDEQDRFDK